MITSVLGVEASMVYSPKSVDDCSNMLAHAERFWQSLAFVGGGTELDLGAPPADLDAIVSSERMTRIPDYAPADMVITAEAGVTLAQLQATVRGQRQMLALDAPNPERATIGGLVATGAYGPRRARYGAIRDLIIGVTMVRADGAVAHGGGKVVKNVAGFDLPKVACGSLGTLGMIANATFRLHPLPEAASTVRFDSLTADRVFALVKSVRDAQLEPTSAVAIFDSTYSLAFRFEGFAKGVEQQTERILALGRGERDDGAFWARHDAVRGGGSLRVRIASLPSRIVDVDKAVARSSVRCATRRSRGTRPSASASYRATSTMPLPSPNLSSPPAAPFRSFWKPHRPKFARASTSGARFPTRSRS